MPVTEDHLTLACHNLQVLNHLSTNQQYSDWFVTITAYTALHLFEALLFEQKNEQVRIQHCSDHGIREEVLKASYPSIWKHYRPLIAASNVARYLKINEGMGQTFKGYYSLDMVCDIMFVKHLGSIISQIKSQLNNDKIFKDIECDFAKCKSSLKTNYH
jgi:hypothetical protein